VSPERGISFHLVFCCVFGIGVAGAQTAIDDVHVIEREKPVTIASAAYSTATAGAGLIKASADLVLVPVTITDDRHRPIVGLDQQNFQIFENKKPQAIKNFSSEDAPVSIGILVDSSGSMSYKLDRAREAVEQFCDAANPQDEFFMITFADMPRMTTGFTDRPQDIEHDLLTLRSKGETALLDAIYLGVRKMRRARYARKALLIISDGGDNHSRFTEHDVKAAIRESDVTIYSVGTFESWVNTQEELLGPDLLRDIAGLTDSQSALNSAVTIFGPNCAHNWHTLTLDEAKRNFEEWVTNAIPSCRLPWTICQSATCLHEVFAAALHSCLKARTG